ncbi:MAG: class I SAM-dependent methyltransferase [Pseudomonadota bacterium]
MNYVTPLQAQRIGAVPHLARGLYQDLDIEGTIDFMARRYVDPIGQRVDLGRATMADCAAGYGWLSIAFLLRGGAEAILIDPDAERLAGAQEICRILGVADRCRFLNRTLQDTGLDDDAVDIFATIETLEHVGRDAVEGSVKEITRVTRRLVVLTTPNRIFPVVAHDTALPFAHWLPRPLRRGYAAAFGRLAREQGNCFLAPWDLKPLAAKFRPDSRIHTFNTVEEMKRFYPHYLPYGDPAKRRRQRPNALLLRYQALLAALLRTRAYSLAPNLASVWVRHESR